MEDKKITEKESLEIITQMIQKTRRNVVDGNYFIYLGLSLMALSLIAGAFTLLTKKSLVCRYQHVSSGCMEYLCMVGHT